MKKPKMIIFDYGHTLLYESGFSPLNGEKALYPYIKRNKNNLSVEQIYTVSNQLFEEFYRVKNIGYEITNQQLLKLLYESLDIELKITYKEAEQIHFDGMSKGALMPDIENLIDLLNILDIRSGIISNTGLSQETLKLRIDELLPNNRFEFIISSSEYGIRKPNKMLFDIALNKAKLEPADVWFCGDNAEADIMGASSAGMYPIWYCNKTIKNPYKNDEKTPLIPSVDYLYIEEWMELIDILRKF